MALISYENIGIRFSVSEDLFRVTFLAFFTQKFIRYVLEGCLLFFELYFQCLESLSLADSKLKGETAYIINALGSNETLLEIDIR